MRSLTSIRLGLGLALVAPATAAAQSARATEAQAASRAADAQGPRVAEVQVAPPYLRMLPDAQTRVTATAYDTTGTPLNVKFRWQSSNVNVALVDSTGTVRAVAPGQALLTAAPMVETRGRRRVGQITVRVVPPPAAGQAQIGPPPGTPGAPPPPAAPPTPPTFMTNQRALDSMMKASINCNEPLLNSVNPLNACWDLRPRPRFQMNALNSSACPDQHGGIMLMVKVSETGTVNDVRAYVTSRCPEVTDSVVAQARQLTFSPAMKDGQPVEAWVRLQVRTGGLLPPREPMSRGEGPPREPGQPPAQPVPPKP